MSKNETYKRWLDAAYHEFAISGPEFSLKALSNKTMLPRATLYYHFFNKEELINELLNYHSTLAEKFQEELKLINSLIPDLYIILYKHKLSVRFNQQLLRNCHIEKYNAIYSKANSDTIQILLPHIKNYFKFNHSEEDIFRFYIILTDAWYSRLDFSNFSVESMITLAEEIMENVLGIFQHSKSIE